MFLYSKREQVADKNRDTLIETSKNKKVPVARMDYWYETKKQQNKKERCAYRSHFNMQSFVQSNEFCVGLRVALKHWNILPSAGLYNGVMGTVVEIVCLNLVGPNNKEHYDLPDSAVVDFSRFNLPYNTHPWDSKHPTVSSYRTNTHTHKQTHTHVLMNNINTIYVGNTTPYSCIKHVPIPMKASLCRKGWCNVKWCPLVISWVSTIHKFLGFEADFDKSDMFKYLICDPGNLENKIVLELCTLH